MKRSTKARLASGLQSALLDVRRPGSESSEWRSVLVPWPGCYHLNRQPRGGSACHLALPLLFSFLSPSPSLSQGNANAWTPAPTPPHCYFKSLLPSVSGSARGWQNRGRWDDSRKGWVEVGWWWWKKKSFSQGSWQPPTVFSVVLIRNLLKLFNLAAELRCMLFKGRCDQPRPLKVLEESHASVGDLVAINNF